MGETTGATKPTRKAKSARATPSLQAAPVDGLETFIEAVPYGVAMYDTDGRVVRSNATYRQTLARFIPKRPAATLRGRVKQSPMRDTTGRPLPEERWPLRCRWRRRAF